MEIYDSLSDRQSLTFRCTLLNFLIKLSHSLPKTNQSSKHISLLFNHTTFLLKKTKNKAETIEPVHGWIGFQHLSLPCLGKCAQYLQRLNWPSRLSVDSLPLCPRQSYPIRIIRYHHLLFFPFLCAFLVGSLIDINSSFIYKAKLMHIYQNLLL